MKIAILDSYFMWPPRGGGIRDIKEIGNGLIKRGHEVVLTAPKYDFRGALKNEDELYFKTRIINFSKTSFNGFYLYKEMSKALRDIKPDLVIIGNGNHFKPYMFLAARKYPTVARMYSYEFLCPISHGVLFKNGHVCKSNFISQPNKCIYCLFDRNYHHLYNYELFRSFAFLYPVYNTVLKKSLKYPKKYVLLSKYMLKRYSEVVSADRLQIIPPGIDIDVFAPVMRRPKKVSKIFFPSRPWDPLKGLSVLLAAGEILWKRRQDFQIVITGDPYMQVEKYPFVTKKDWYIDIPNEYATSDIVVVPSIWAEPFGLGALEAMSCSTAVIASKIGGLTDFIDDGKTGVLVPPGNPTELASKLDVLLDDEKYRQRLGDSARKSVMEKYVYSHIVNQFASIIEELD